MKFDELNLNKPLLNALNDLGYIHPTTIQQKGFSVIMSGRDMIGIAQTGTGKTLAYLLPCLRQWEFSKVKTLKILIVVPTRELVTQVVEVAQKLSEYMSITICGVYGGANIKVQMAMLAGGTDVLVATPGRLIDLIMNGTVNLKTVKRLVIDEVDEMLGLGFRYQLTTILNLLPPRRQNLMFSATLTDEVELLIKDYFNNPVKIEAAPTGTPLDNIAQRAYQLPNFNTKVNLLKLLLADKEKFEKVLVFAATKKQADQLFEQLEPVFPEQIGVIHSNKSQNYRFAAVKKFHQGENRVLIATDVIARGIDISEVSHVINFDVPDEAENYIHRIGRTGRADKEGIAITFITPKEEPQLQAIEALMNYKIPVLPLPENLEISDVLTADELPQAPTDEIQDKFKRKTSAGAFHEKKEKNKKVNVHLTRAKKLKLKYGKPKTRGQKPPRRG
jgi:ATP-dependent RNA helicase RhlE